MAIRGPSLRGAIQKQVASYVSWLMSRSYSTKDIVTRVKDRFSSRYVDQATAETRYYKAQQTTADRFRKAAPAAKVAALNAPMRGWGGDTMRYTVDFTFKNPRTRVVENRTHIIDLGGDLTKRQVQAKLRDMVLNDILRSYISRQATRASIRTRVGSISVSRIEAIS